MKNKLRRYLTRIARCGIMDPVPGEQPDDWTICLMLSRVLGGGREDLNAALNMYRLLQLSYLNKQARDNKHEDCTEASS